MRNRRHFFQAVVKYALFFLVLYFFVLFLLRISDREEFRLERFRAQTFTLYQCPVESKFNFTITMLTAKLFSRNSPTKNVYKRILLVAALNSTYYKTISAFLAYFKVPIRVEIWRDDDLTSILEVADEGMFTLIVFENYRQFAQLAQTSKLALLKYCNKFGVGIISLFFSDVSNKGEKFDQFSAIGKNHVENLRFNANSGVSFIAKSGINILIDLNAYDWTLFSVNGDAEVILFANDSQNKQLAAEILIREQFNVSHIVIGQNINQWVIKLAVLDAVIYLAPNLAAKDLDRFIQIDIDDIFVGKSGTKLTTDDVQSLIKTQKDLRAFIKNFTFLLGFSGFFFRQGDSLEALGDEELVALANEFYWFPHMWRHNQPHNYQEKYLQDLMMQNKLFAKSMKLNTSMRYAVSPKHSSVYPIYEPLYRAWLSIWNVSVTSTEQYLHFKPASSRSGFVHNNISVLPRQTCGLFTHTFFFYAYPKGIENLYRNIFGGELFTTVLMNKFSIFMTHQQNFANDRLGAFTFLNLVRFLKCYTNLKLKWTVPEELARMYFKKFPTERELIYTNPCTDVRHQKILSVNVTCNLILPNVVILGPQKTGTSALSMFLSLHSNVLTNKPIEHYFEELQFFGGVNYHHGLDWYAEKFSELTNSTDNDIIFEKSANYFDNTDAPRSLKALLPNAKLIILMINPVDRAYSLYQHMLAKNDTTAMNFSAEQVLMNNLTSTSFLQKRCLLPGMYVRYLQRWLDYFLPSQIIIVDGESLRFKPERVISMVYSQLGLSKQAVNLSKRLKFVFKKRFFCAVNLKGKSKCLGRSKGRKYVPMSAELRKFLSYYYKPYNEALLRLLTYHKFSPPSFLFSNIF